MDLYKRAIKLQYLDPQYNNKWVLCPGAFHTVICAIRCLGKTIEGSGLDETWQCYRDTNHQWKLSQQGSCRTSIKKGNNP